LKTKNETCLIEPLEGSVQGLEILSSALCV